MKRKYLIALTLPALLAACTQEEIGQEAVGNDRLNLVENPIENFSLEVNVGDEAETRLTTDSKWEVGDKMGLVWFNPQYKAWDGSFVTLNTPEFYANNQFTINNNNGTAQWNSDAVIMEGTHFAYFPFQTVWGDEYLQVKGGQEILKVYNTTEQKDDVNNRLDWMMNHQTMLSPVYSFTGDNGAAGISDSRRINLYLFSNRLNIKPEFVNGPSDLMVYGYTLQTQDNYTSIMPFVTEAEILANKLPTSDKFGESCNWANIGKMAIKLSDIYNPTKYASALNVTYETDVNSSEAPKFAFLLLPAVDKGQWQVGSNSETNPKSQLELVAHTNYGDITITEVAGKFDPNTTNESVITLSKLYYNAETGNLAQNADVQVGFINNAGTTRGASTGVNGDIKATFDFANIEYTLPFVCDNQSYDRALEMIKNYNEKLGEQNFTVTLCEQPEFTDLAFTKGIEAVEEELGVNIKVQGQVWYDEIEKKHVSEITWHGTKNSIEQRISNVEHFIADGATLSSTVAPNANGNGLNATTVLNGGTLKNYWAAESVTVEKGGKVYNYDTKNAEYTGSINKVVNYGTVSNMASYTTAKEDQPVIGDLYNYGLVNNYAEILDVKENNNATTEVANTAKIVLLDNTNKFNGATIGAMFSILAADSYDTILFDEMGWLDNNIEYTVDDANSVIAGRHLAIALNNYATNVLVKDGVNIDATAGVALNGNEYKARITFEGKTAFTFSSAAQFDNEFMIGEIILAKGATVTFKNQLVENGGQPSENDYYGLVAYRTALNDGASFTLNNGVQYITRTLYVEPKATVKITTGELYSKILYRYFTQEGATVTSNGNINLMPDFIKEHFGWE